MSMDSHDPRVIQIARGISILHLSVERRGCPYELIVTLSESANEVFRHSLVVVPVPLALAA